MKTEQKERLVIGGNRSIDILIKNESQAMIQWQLTNQILIPSKQEDGTIVYDSNKYGKYFQFIAWITMLTEDKKLNCHHVESDITTLEALNQSFNLQFDPFMDKCKQTIKDILEGKMKPDVIGGIAI